MASIKKSTVIQLIILVLVAIAAGISCIWSRDIELKTGLLHYEKIPNAEEISSSLSIYYVDVGQGDCTIVALPDGKTIIIDAGRDNSYTRNSIDAFIASTFTDFTYFDYAILTHPDSDHCGSFDYVLEKYPAQFIYRPNVKIADDPGIDDLSSDAILKSTAVYARAINAMYETTEYFTPTVYVTDPSDDSQTISGGEGDDRYSLTFFSPLTTCYGTDDNADWNEYSPIMILEYRGFKFAMSGDAEKVNEAEFVAKVAAAKTDGITDKYDIFTDDFCVNAIKAGHHGSRTSTSQAYIDVMTTTAGAKSVYYIISCGDGNSYGHPHSEILDRLSAMGVPEENILRTDKVGTITLTVKVDESEGNAYALFYGNNKSDQTPSGPSDVPDNSQESENSSDATEKLVYYKLGGMDITWPFVVWVAYAVFFLTVITQKFTVGRRARRR